MKNCDSMADLVCSVIAVLNLWLIVAKYKIIALVFRSDKEGKVISRNFRFDLVIGAFLFGSTIE